MRRAIRFLSVGLAVAGALGPGANAADAYIYWSNYGPGGNVGTTIGRADLDGSGIDGNFIPDASGETGITVDGSYVYWANDGANAIGRANLNGTDPDPTFIPDATSGASASPGFIATDGTYIYWTDGQRYVGRANLDGSDAEPHFLDVGSGSYPHGIAVSSGTVYVAGTNEIVSIDDSAGSTPAPVTTLKSGAYVGLAIAGDELYFSEFGGASNGIWSVTTTGTGLTELLDVALPGAVAIGGPYLYWTANTPGYDDGTIGRGQLTSSGLTAIDPAFITGAGNAAGVAVDSLIDPTDTTVSCLPADVAAGSASTCTATVHDSASPSPPAGTVAFGGSASTFFSGSASSCTLHIQPDGLSGCTVGAVSISPGPVTISAAYGGDPVHEASSGTASFCAGTTAQCSPPPAHKPACVVPHLGGKTLRQARKLLSKAHCELGKLTKPRHARGRLVVASTKPTAGHRLANDSKVAVKLIVTRRRRR